MSIRYFLLALLTLAVVVGTILVAAAPVLAYLDLPSAGVVVLPALLMGFAAHRPREVGRAYRVAFRSRAASREELEDAAAYFDALCRYVACGGGIGVTVGLVATLLTLTDPSRVGRFIALSLLSVLYAVIAVAVIVVPFRTAVRRRLAALAK